MDQYAINVVNLSKSFHTRSGLWKNKRKTINAVRGISFSINRGEVFGLLGPNGAGKTTTVKMLTTLLLPTGGKASILGFDVINQTRNVRKHIGFSFSGSRGLYNRLTANQNLKYFAELYALEPEISKKRIPELLELVGLDGRGDDRVETYSSGMAQRLHLARALLHDPDILFLDEPTVGIDPVGSRDLRNTIKNLITLGKTILLTTHYMAEAEELCEKIAIINQGKIIVNDTPDALKKKISGDTVIEVSVSATRMKFMTEILESYEGKLSFDHKVNTETAKFTIRSKNPERIMELLSPYLNHEYLLGLEVRNQTLEDVYIAIIQGEQV